MDHLRGSKVAEQNTPQPQAAVRLYIEDLALETVEDTLGFVEQLSKQLGGTCQQARHEFIVAVNLPAAERDCLFCQLDAKGLDFSMDTEILTG